MYSRKGSGNGVNGEKIGKHCNFSNKKCGVGTEQEGKMKTGEGNRI